MRTLRARRPSVDFLHRDKFLGDGKDIAEERSTYTKSVICFVCHCVLHVQLDNVFIFIS